jgi:spermidine/putrescine transport system substrate-binding protein
LLTPSSYTVQTLKRKGMLATLDHSKLPNLKNVDAKYLAKALDPKMELSVPYMTGPTCLCYLASKVSNPTDSWAMLDRGDLKGRVTLLDDMREVLGAALKLLGHSLNSTDPAQLAAARDIAIRWKKNIAKFENEQYKTGIASGEFYLVQGYGGDLIQASSENQDMRIFVPKEGTAFSCDDMCIPKSAKNSDLAHAFINHLTDPEVAAKNMEEIGYRTPNTAAYTHLSEDFRGSPILFPPDELFAKCEPIGDLGDKLQLWTEEWDKVKTA